MEGKLLFVLIMLVIAQLSYCLLVDSNCRDQLSDCDAYGDYACKGTHEKWARMNCARFCGFCGSGVSTTSAPTVCQDKLSDCAEYGKQACEGAYITWAKSHCAAYCGFCPSTSSSCHDVLADCAAYGVDACVGKYVSWAKKNCAKFCDLCDTNVTQQCNYKGKNYNKGETWNDGCNFTCTCKTDQGYYECTSRCPYYTSIPSYCQLVKENPSDCCSKLVCNTTGTGTTISGNRCLYQGKYYDIGASWTDGCKARCTCEAAGRYQCFDRCYTWNMPSTCTLEPPAPGKCCQTPKCPSNVHLTYPPGYKED